MLMKEIRQLPPYFNLACCACGKRDTNEPGRQRMFADLDGPPFFAYYCEPCAEAAKHTASALGEVEA